LAVLSCAAPVGAATSAGAQKPKSGAILPGGNSNKPINIEAAKLDYFDKEQKLVYTGSVVAVQGESKLKSTVLTIFLAPKKAGDPQAAQSSTSQVQRMIAKGPVTLLQRDQIGTGDNGVYDKASNTVVLTGNVTLSQGPNVTKGDRLVYDLKSGRAVVTAGAGGGPVKSMFLPRSSAASDDQKQ
jgi:lipopolysaccharide export system protein LptA